MIFTGFCAVYPRVFMHMHDTSISLKSRLLLIALDTLDV